VLQRFSDDVGSQCKPMAPPTPPTLPPLPHHSGNSLPSFSPRAPLLNPSLPSNETTCFAVSPNPIFVNNDPGEDLSVERMHQEGMYNHSPESSPLSAEAGGMQGELSRRGKGHHTCPHMLQCAQGGVRADGSLVVFERNSAYRAHLQKHDRPYKCDLPGCTNRRGFARADQLRRHQETTRHE
jgi:hypothetical protein